GLPAATAGTRPRRARPRPGCGHRLGPRTVWSEPLPPPRPAAPVHLPETTSGRHAEGSRRCPPLGSPHARPTPPPTPSPLVWRRDRRPCTEDRSVPTDTDSPHRPSLHHSRTPHRQTSTSTRELELVGRGRTGRSR